MPLSRNGSSRQRTYDTAKLIEGVGVFLAGAKSLFSSAFAKQNRFIKPKNSNYGFSIA